MSAGFAHVQIVHIAVAVGTDPHSGFGRESESGTHSGHEIPGGDSRKVLVSADNPDSDGTGNLAGKACCSYYDDCQPSITVS